MRSVFYSVEDFEEELKIHIGEEFNCHTIVIKDETFDCIQRVDKTLEEFLRLSYLSVWDEEKEYGLPVIAFIPVKKLTPTCCAIFRSVGSFVLDGTCTIVFNNEYYEECWEIYFPEKVIVHLKDAKGKYTTKCFAGDDLIESPNIGLGNLNAKLELVGSAGDIPIFYQKMKKLNFDK